MTPTLHLELIQGKSQALNLPLQRAEEEKVIRDMDGGINWWFSSILSVTELMRAVVQMAFFQSELPTIIMQILFGLSASKILQMTLILNTLSPYLLWTIFLSA
jgi:hypothetical protein